MGAAALPAFAGTAPRIEKQSKVPSVNRSVSIDVGGTRRRGTPPRPDSEKNPKISGADGTRTIDVTGACNRLQKKPVSPSPESWDIDKSISNNLASRTDIMRFCERAIAEGRDEIVQIGTAPRSRVIAIPTIRMQV